MKTVKELSDKAEWEGGLPDLLFCYKINPDKFEGELVKYSERIINIQKLYDALEYDLMCEGFGEEEENESC